VGQAVNLLSNDVNRFDMCLVFFVYVWIGPVQTLIMLCLMWHEIGVAALIGVATVLLFIPVQGVYYWKVIINKMESASVLTE
jgi:ATP-binding cassette subfamily C (CFTR/MRP) protein 4